MPQVTLCKIQNFEMFCLWKTRVPSCLREEIWGYFTSAEGVHTKQLQTLRSYIRAARIDIQYCAIPPLHLHLVLPDTLNTQGRQTRLFCHLVHVPRPFRRWQTQDCISLEQRTDNGEVIFNDNFTSPPHSLKILGSGHPGTCWRQGFSQDSDLISLGWTLTDLTTCGH